MIHIHECIEALYNGPSMNQTQVLAIVSEVRKLVSCDELRVEKILSETKVLDLCIRML